MSISSNADAYKILLQAWDKILANPSPEFVEAFTKEAAKHWGSHHNGHLHCDSIEEFIRGRLVFGTTAGGLDHERMIAWRSPFVWTDDNGKYKHTTPQWFVFLGTKYFVSTWKSMLIRLCELVAEDNPGLFRHAKRIRGEARGHNDGRVYFSTTPDGLADPRLVADTGVFVETNLQANNTHCLCRVLVRHFGYFMSAKREEDVFSTSAD